MFALNEFAVIIKMRSAWIVSLALLIFLSSCIGQPETLSQPTVTPTVPVFLTPTRVTPTQNPKPKSTEHSAPIPTPTATITPRQNVKVTGPEIWLEPLEIAVSALEEDLAFQWSVTSDKSMADLSIVSGGGKYPVGDVPIALTVPFTAEFGDLTQEQAQSILLNGNALVEAVAIPKLTPERRALKVDGKTPFNPEYPLKQQWSIVPDQGFEEAAGVLSQTLLPIEPMNVVIKIAAVGDIMLDRSLGIMIAQGETSYPFDEISEALSAADLTMGNLESSLGNTGQPTLKSYTFQAPIEAARSLGEAGFDIVSLANNHALDYGPDALLQGIDLLKDQGVATVGAGENVDAAREAHYVNINGINVAVLGYVDVPIEGGGFDTSSWSAGPDTPGLVWADPATIAMDVAKAAAEADIVIVQLHSGYEYVEQPSSEQTIAAKSAVDAGADLVLGHHSHLLQGIEFYNGGVIVYGLGNFAFEIDGDPQTAILNVWLDSRGVLQLELIPAIVQFGGQPRLANPSEQQEILRKVHYLTGLLKPD